MIENLKGELKEVKESASCICEKYEALVSEHYQTLNELKTFQSSKL